MTGTVAHISLASLRQNVRLLRSRVEPATVLAVVKDDGYGHGVDVVVDVLRDEGISRFGTVELGAALTLKRRAPDATVFAWVFDQGDDLGAAIDTGVDLGITSAPMLERLADAVSTDRGRPALVHLKLDTGLHRAGALAADWPSFVARAVQLHNEKRIVVRGLWTHLAEASDSDDSRSIAEYQRGVAAAEIQGLRAVTRHIAASAAAFYRPDARFDMVRIGAFLYGIAPGGGVGPQELGLRPVMTLRTPLLDVRAGEGKAVGTLGLGGASGILSDAAGTVSVAVRGRLQRVLSVGLECMTIDLEDSAAQPGDDVTLFGPGSSGEQTLQVWADAMGTIGEEIVTRLSTSIPRINLE